MALRSTDVASARPSAGSGLQDVPHSDRRRWIALIVLCVGQLMIVLDATVVNVALPTIQRELHFSQGQVELITARFVQGAAAAMVDVYKRQTTWQTRA